MASEITEILMPGSADLPTFTVDTSGPEAVAISQGTLPKLLSGGNQDTFQKDDNILILSYGFVFPLSFQFYQKNAAPFIPILKTDLIAIGITTSINYFFDEFFRVRIPMENYEIPIEVFLDIQNKGATGGNYLKNENFHLHFGVLSPTENAVSMYGVPPALNGKTYPILPFLKVVHNLPMV